MVAALVVVALAALTGTGAMAQASSSCSMEADTDFNGNDLSRMPAGDAASCCDACTADGACAAWTLIPSAVSQTESPSSGTCFLKSSSAGRRAMPGYTSGASAPKAPTPAPTPFRCSSDEDCSLNGVCDSATGECECDKPWHGATDCSRLVFKPAPVSSCGKACAYHAMAQQNTSWGGSVLHHNGTYFMAAAEMEGGCTLGQWQTNSQVALAVSSTPLAPYSKLSVAVPPWSHNPQLAQHTDGTFLIYTLGNGTAGPHGPGPVPCGHGARDTETGPGPGRGLAQEAAARGPGRRRRRRAPLDY